MHLVEVRTRGFRNLPAVVPIAEPVAVVVGENNAGKSNLIDAMRSTLRPLHSYREQHEITIDDFAADPASGEPITAELAVELVFDGLDQHARGRMLTCLSADGRALLGVRAELTDAGRVRTTMFGGDAKLDEPDLRTLLCTDHDSSLVKDREMLRDVLLDSTHRRDEFLHGCG